MHKPLRARRAPARAELELGSASPVHSVPRALPPRVGATKPFGQAEEFCASSNSRLYGLAALGISHAMPCVTEVLASAEARAAVESRYLAGHPALFPDEAVRFTEQLAATQRQTVLAMRLAELDGLDQGEPAHPDAVAVRAEAHVEDLVEPAKVTALEKLGDGRRALSIATRWLRGKAESPEGYA